MLSPMAGNTTHHKKGQLKYTHTDGQELNISQCGTMPFFFPFPFSETYNEGSREANTIKKNLDIDITGLLLEVQLRFNFLIQFFCSNIWKLSVCLCML